MAVPAQADTENNQVCRLMYIFNGGQDDRGNWGHHNLPFAEWEVHIGGADEPDLVWFNDDGVEITTESPSVPLPDRISEGRIGLASYRRVPPGWRPYLAGEVEVTTEVHRVYFDQATGQVAHVLLIHIPVADQPSGNQADSWVGVMMIGERFFYLHAAESCGESFN